jgi:hypothetical protein
MTVRKVADLPPNELGPLIVIRPLTDEEMVWVIAGLYFIAGFCWGHLLGGDHARR